MKISSPFKDYYDYVSHQYGGGDPSILYLRNRLAPMQSLSGSYYPSTINVEQKNVRKLPYADNYVTFRWLAVCGKYYLLTRNITPHTVMLPWRILNEREHSETWKCLTKRVWHRQKLTPGTYWVDDFQEELVELSRKVNAPVFTFNSSRTSNDITVDSEIPVLSKFDFHRYYSAEQLYQNLSYFMGNQIKESPDLAPKTNMTDKEKITQHGFDIKQSFRHRK